MDRPPLLVSLFGVTARLGGAVPLRLLGCLATAAIVLGSADVARRMAGPQAARWSAAVAAAFCVSPLLGSLTVDGELLAAPFVVAGMSAALRALNDPREHRAVWAGVLAGAAMAAALLVKQNMADGGVFAAVAFCVAYRRREVSTRRLLRLVAAFTTGAAVALAAVTGWTLMHGTSPTGVYDALYPFRIEAGRVLAASSHQHATARLWMLVGSWVVSGGAVLMALAAWSLLSRRLQGAAAWALVATMTFDLVSIGMGGNYWKHYLVQLLVPVAVISGVLVAAHQPATKRILVSAAVVAFVAWAAVLPGSGGETAAWSVGQAVGRAAAPGDTIVTALGHADITDASGLRSPYPYLWSLPSRTLDPGLTTLNGLLTGQRAPTWFVRYSNLGSLGRGGMATERLLGARYHPVATLHGQTVYLVDGANRPTPRLPGFVGTHDDAHSAPASPRTPG